MTPTEAAALLTICASFDNRKPDENAATAWAMALDDLRFIDCREAIVVHYRTSREWIMPVNIREGVKRVRIDRWNAFVEQIPGKYLLPPARFADDPDAELRWVHDVNARVRDGEVTHPDQIDDERGELKPHDVIAELGQIGRSVPRA
jgi:hypothetical protein